MNVSYNQIESLGTHLPESLEQLYCTHNQIRDLFLAGCPRIETLHCKYNAEKMRIYDLPDTIIDGQYPDHVTYLSSSSSSSSTSASKTEPTSKEYQKKIEDYFRTKEKYENALHYRRVNKKLRNELPPCIGCNRLVGMVFSGKDQKYRAYCGSKDSPCEWKIMIHRGNNVPLLPFLQEIKDHLEETKSNIIRQKMDTLFGYISDEKSAELFKKYIQFFETNGELVEKYTSLYKDIYFNEEKRDLIQRKQARIQEKLMEVREHLSSENPEDRQEAVRIQFEEIQPIAKYIQSQTYADMSVESFWRTERSVPENLLYQSETVLSQVEINIGEK